MKFRLYPILIFILALSYSGFSQEIIYSNDKNENITAQDQNIVESDNSKKTNSDSKVSYNIEMGSIFTTGKSFGNLSFYTAPQVNYRFTPKMSVSAGVMLINTSISNYYLVESQRKQNFNQAFLFGGIDYQATQKLRISGDILYGMNTSPYNVSNQINKKDYYVRFSAEYKINENLSIGLQIINQNMGYPGYGGSFGYDPFGSSYYSPFGR